MQSRAMILAAGMGSRLRPLTDSTPKALLPFRGKTMLEHVTYQLKSHGFKEVVINVHHQAEQVPPGESKKHGASSSPWQACSAADTGCSAA